MKKMLPPKIKIARLTLTVLLVLFAFFNESFAGIRTAVTGNWSTTASGNTAWNNGLTTGTVTTSADTLIIPTGVTVTVQTATCTGGALIVETGGTLAFTSSSTRNINIVSGGGYSGTVTINGTVSMANSNGQFIAYNGPTFTLGATSSWAWAGTSSGADGGIHYTGTTATTLFGNGMTCGSLSVTAAGGTVNLSGNVTIKGQGTSFGVVLLQTSTSNLNINAGDILTLATNSTASVPWIITSGGKATVGGVVDDKSGGVASLAGTGAITVNNNATYIHNHTGSTLIGATANTVTWNTGSTLEVRGITGTSPTAASLSQAFYNFTWNCAGQSSNISLAQANTMSVIGAFTVTNTNAAASATRALRLNANTPTTYSLNIGSLVLNGGNFSLSGGSSSNTLNVTTDVSMSNGSILDLSQGSSGNCILNVGGDLSAAAGTTITETSTGTTNTIVFNKSGAQSLNINNGAILSNDVSYTVNSGSTVTLPGGKLVIGGGAVLTIAGNLDLNSNDLTLRSTVTSTARMAPVTGTITNASNITVERFIGIPTAKRAWRLLTTPLQGGTNNSVYNNWQVNGAQATGSGTLITGPAADPATNGLDVTSGYSLKSFDGTAFVGVDNTKTTSLFTAAAGTTPGNNSYFLFVRGDRSSLTDLTNVTQTTLKATGALQTGDKAFATSAASGGFTLVGNPYASPVDFDKFRIDNINSPNTLSNIKPNFYYWDPKLSGVGGYVTVTYDGTGSSYTITNAGTREIQSGQAIFLEQDNTSTGPALVTFKETQKSANVVNNAFRTGTQIEKLEINLKLVNSDASLTQADGIIAKYNNIYSVSVGNEDANKIMNIDENLGFARYGKTLSVEGRPLVDAADTLFLTMNNLKPNAAYKFEINPTAFDAPLLNAYLEDAVKGTSTPLSLTDPTVVDFVSATSIAADRFRIVFRSNSALPINFTAVKAYSKNAGIQVDWNLASESNMSSYQVEKSADGRTFAQATVVKAKANNSTAASYNWFDAAPFNGDNFYRIKAIENGGAVKYSEVVRVKIGKGNSEITLYPNPVVGNTFSLQFTNQVKGTYSLKLFNNLGQTVFAKTIEHTGGSATQTINLGNTVGKGVYQLQVSNGDTKLNQKVIRN